MIDLKDVLAFLKDIDGRLNKHIMLIAVGGTAMVFLNLKESTKDVDFCIESKYLKDFNNARKEKEEFRIDIFKDGYIFCQQLPEDYIKMSILFKDFSFKNIELRCLNPLDIIVTKVNRLNERDKEDIAALIKTKRIKKERLIQRFDEIKKSYALSDADLEYNFKWLIKTFFG